jgi:hypothetical protein
MFTGSEKSEIIKLWDVRARSAIYELATGNNMVVSMTWDSAHSSLYAATECNYIDRLGHNHGYRRAKMPKPSSLTHDNVDGEDEESDGYDSDDDDDRAWPEQAFHAEDYFGYTFDAGDHQICRFGLKF